MQAKGESMAGTLHRADSIDSSGFPLGFKVRQGLVRPGVLGGKASKDLFRVELRAMGGHQKEAVVSEGATGSVFRAVSDEGPALMGTDLAPMPLGFMNAGMMSDLQNRFMQLAAARAIRVDACMMELHNAYLFVGSFFRGDGHGSAQAPRFRLKITSPAPAGELHVLALAALDASPLVAMCRSPLENTFAFYVNGTRRPLVTLPPSSAPDAADPLKIWKNVPAPLAGANDLPDMVAKLATITPSAAPPVDPAATQRRAINVYGVSRWLDGVTESEVIGSGSRFGLKSDERPDTDKAPSGLALAAMGVAFCLSTQFLRYAEHHKMNLRALRIVQDSPFETTGNAAQGTLRARAYPMDTHIFLHGEESDERMEKLLIMAQNTCYLHALLHDPLAPQIELEVNGVAVAA